MQHKRPPRVLGPYHEGSRWRVITVGAQSRRSFIAHSEAQARELIRREVSLLQAVPETSDTPPSPILAGALRQYEAHLLHTQKMEPQSVRHTVRTLRNFLPYGTLPLDAMTPQAARALARFAHPSVRRIRRSYAASTRRAVLGHATRFYRWATERRYIARNPFDGVTFQGIVGTGERRLNQNQAQTWAGLALAESEAGDVRALGALLILGMRLQSKQVLSLRVGDIDLAGQRIRVYNARRQERWFPIPKELLSSLHTAIAARDSQELLLGLGRTGHVRPRNYLWRTVHRLCESARVPTTCPRALRTLSSAWDHSAQRLSHRLTQTFAHSRRMHTPVLTVRTPRSAPSVRGADLMDLGDQDESPLFVRASAIVSRLESFPLSRRRRTPQ